MLIDPIKTYTYKDYLNFDENERIEIIEGEIINMSQLQVEYTKK